MATSSEDIRLWLKEGKKQGATHTIVVCDTFDHEDYPVHVMRGEDVHAKVANHSNPNNMSRVMEVYSHAIDHETQLAESRAFHLE